MTLCSPQVAAGSQTDLGFVEEVCFGEIPPSVTLTVCPRRSTTLGLTKEAYDSELIKSNRMVVDSRHGIRRGGGDVVGELIPGAYAAFHAALNGGIYTSFDAVDLSLVANNLTVATATGAYGRTYLTATFGTADADALGIQFGDVITFAGTGNADFDGLRFTVSRITTSTNPNDRLILIPPKGWAGAGASLTAGTLSLPGARVGVGNIYRSYLFERAFTDIGRFMTLRGNRLNQAVFDLPPSGIATATYTFLGKDADALTGGSLDGVAEIVKDGTALGNLTFDAATKTITMAGGTDADWTAAGFGVGDRILIDGDGVDERQNRNARTVVSIAGTSLVVAEAIADGGATGTFSVTRVGLPAYTAAPANEVLVAVSGQLIFDDQPIATLTGFNLTVNNQMGGSPVTGDNTIPALLWGNQQLVTGTITALFDFGGPGNDLYNRFEAEQTGKLMVRLDEAVGGGFIQFSMPRVKFNTGSIGDAVAEGLPVEIEYRGLEPTDPLDPPTQVIIQESEAVPA